MLFRKTEKSPDDFWREYEEKTGERVLARSLGQYISGWEEFDSRRLTGLWGLIISTSGGFRFHHFPQQSWFDALSRTHEAPKEKTIFIPREKIISARLIVESRWWKKIFNPSLPHLLIHYRDAMEQEKQLLLEAERTQGNLTESLMENASPKQ